MENFNLWSKLPGIKGTSDSLSLAVDEKNNSFSFELFFCASVSNY